MCLLAFAFTIVFVWTGPQLARQSYSMQTELPTMLNVFEADNQLEYSDTTVAIRDTIIERYQYCTCLQRAFQSLIHVQCI